MPTEKKDILITKNRGLCQKTNTTTVMKAWHNLNAHFTFNWIRNSFVEYKYLVYFLLMRMITHTNKYYSLFYEAIFCIYDILFSLYRKCIAFNNINRKLYIWFLIGLHDPWMVLWPAMIMSQLKLFDAKHTCSVGLKSFELNYKMCLNVW